MLFIDGVSGCMKTTVLGELEKHGYKVVYSDYAELLKVHDMFKNKHTDQDAQIAYTLFVMGMAAEGSDVGGKVICDRSPASDLWYQGVNKLIAYWDEHPEEPIREMQIRAIEFLDTFFIKRSDKRRSGCNCGQIVIEPKLNAFKVAFTKYINRYKTVVVIPTWDHIDEILEQMKKRDNKIDTMTKHYIIAQILIFDSLYKYFDLSNFHYFVYSGKAFYTDNQLASLKNYILELQ